MLKPILLKLGGSLIHHQNINILRQIGEIISQCSTEYPILIVPGGGPFADLVRQYGSKLKLSEQTCHFMALSAMDQYAFLLQEFITGSKLTDLANREFPIHMMTNSSFQPQILFCSQFCRKLSVNELPRSWDVTSDSIAAYLAKELDCTMLVILKSTDIGLTLREPDVDSFFHQLLPLDMPVWFLNGLYPERLSRLLTTGSTQGIYLPPKKTCGQSVL